MTFYRIRSRLLDGEVIGVSTTDDGEELSQAKQNHPDLVIYTASEIGLLHGSSPEETFWVHAGKKHLGGKLVPDGTGQVLPVKGMSMQEARRKYGRRGTA